MRDPSESEALAVIVTFGGAGSKVAPFRGSVIAIVGGTLRVTNLAGTGVLDIRRGTNALNGGLVEVDQLKNVLRKTRITDKSRFENSAEHSWHLALVVRLLSALLIVPSFPR